MTGTRWLDELGELSGEQLYHLGTLLSETRELALAAAAISMEATELAAKLVELSIELDQLRDDVLIQQARITVPMRQAQGIVWRALFARSHPVPVSPT